MTGFEPCLKENSREMEKDFRPSEGRESVHGNGKRGLQEKAGVDVGM